MNGLSTFHDFSPVVSRFREEVLHGLRLPRKTLVPKYFYDEIGSALFEAICALPEYYPTRTETALMQAHAPAMAESIGRRSALIEYGSGVSRKTRLLIAAAQPSVYVPIDIARETLRTAAASLGHAFPDLPIVAVCADYSVAFDLPSLERFGARRRAIYFPGSTIGNFDPEESVDFLRRVARVAGAGGGLLIGVDLRKDAAVLEAAYDDPQGVTAAFNLNLLARINRELGADFDLRAFRHRAVYSQAQGRVEMHLESCRTQTVHIDGEAVEFRQGESIHTENSYKYSVQEFQALAACAGFRARNCWVDDARLFSIHYMEC
ncbi:MAG: L-histidine N(alpha)-methyltransferase [Betaproteobacteria bacterium]|nr:MAG: L-histidine N(alpha)-methyltransferase [Betaproteobacteria bacterium]